MGAEMAQTVNLVGDKFDTQAGKIIADAEMDEMRGSVLANLQDEIAAAIRNAFADGTDEYSKLYNAAKRAGDDARLDATHHASQRLEVERNLRELTEKLEAAEQRAFYNAIEASKLKTALQIADDMLAERGKRAIQNALDDEERKDRIASLEQERDALRADRDMWRLRANNLADQAESAAPTGRE